MQSSQIITKTLLCFVTISVFIQYKQFLFMNHIKLETHFNTQNYKEATKCSVSKHWSIKLREAPYFFIEKNCVE